MLVFPWAGLRPVGNRTSPPISFSPRGRPAPQARELSYASFPQFIRRHPLGQGYAIGEFFGHSFMTALYVAAFQQEFVYEPSYPWGRALALLELLLTSSLIALFLLAVRRHCRR